MTKCQTDCASLGHKQDDESGLVYMRARYYEPTSGRFVSEDPDRQGVDWMVYCNNNPVRFFDGTGKDASDDFYYALGHALLIWGLSIAKGGLAQFLLGSKELVTAQKMEEVYGDFMVLQAKRTMSSGVQRLWAGAIIIMLAQMLNALGSDASDFIKDFAEALDSLKDFLF